MVGIDSVVGAPADQAEGDDILVGIEVMSDGLVELDDVRKFYSAHCMTGNVPLWVAY